MRPSSAAEHGLLVLFEKVVEHGREHAESDEGTESEHQASSGIEPPRTAEYMPSISMMKLPEIPGRIIAHIATAPVPKKTSRFGSLTAPFWKPSRTKATDRYPDCHCDAGRVVVGHLIPHQPATGENQAAERCGGEF